MLCSDNFAVATLQLSAFTPDEDPAPTKVLKELYPELADRFDAAPQVLTRPEGLQPSGIFPLLTFRSLDEEWSLELATKRVSLFWVNVSSEQIGHREAVRKLREVADESLLPYLTKFLPRVGRLAFVIKRFRRVAEPGRALAQHFCRKELLDEPFNRPENFELHSHKSYELEGRWNLNSWVRAKCARLVGEEEAPIVLVEQDLNTLTEDSESASFDGERTREFLRDAEAESVAVLQMYFPSSPGERQ